MNPYNVGDYNKLPKVWCMRKNDNGDYKYGIPVIPCTACPASYKRSVTCKLASEYPNDPRPPVNIF